MTTEAIDPKLAAALVGAQGAVRAALKTSENSFHKYKYASAEEVMAVGRDALQDNGLSMHPISEDFDPLPTIDDRCGGAVAIVRCKYLVLHVSGANLCFSTDVPVVPERSKSGGWSRPADKATFGARTEALGYALRDLLLIPRQDANDVSGRHDRGHAPPPPAPKPDEPLTLGQHIDAARAAAKPRDVGVVLARARKELAGAELDAVYAAIIKPLGAYVAGLLDTSEVEKCSAFCARLALPGTFGESVRAELDAVRARLTKPQEPAS